MMKLLYVLLITLPILCKAYPAADTEKKSISLDDDVDVDSEHASSDKDSAIQKRSGGGGSFSYVTQVKSGILSSLGHASASIASGSSGSSSGSSGSYKSIDGHQGNSLDYDPWSFKKSLLNTIFQAVKAITGGVTALKGQLIKGSGYALSASGNLVATGGEKVTDVGKAIINSAHQSIPTYGPPGHDSGYVHPFAKFSSLSGASSGSSSGTKVVSKPGPVIHTETITSYEIPAGHSNYGPPTKPPTYSSATHQYLPPAGGYGGSGSPFGGGHAAFQEPSNNYLPSSYDAQIGNNDEFNIYGQHKKLSETEANKAALQLQEILNMLPNGNTEYTATKTVVLNPYENNEVHPEHVELQTYGLPDNLGSLQSLSHSESVTASYGPPPKPQPYLPQATDLYHQMEKKKQTPEELYIQKHPNENFYDYPPPKEQSIDNYQYTNYHVPKEQTLNDLTPIIAALAATKRHGPNTPKHTQYTIEKNVHKITNEGAHKYLPPVVHKSKYTYFDPAQSASDKSVVYQPPPPPPVPYKIHHIVSPRIKRKTKPLFKAQDYEIGDPLIFNRVLML